MAADLAFALYSLDLEQEHRHSVEALRESERQLSTLMANLPGMAYRCRSDPEWTMEFISQGCLELTGYTSSDFVENHKMAYADIISDQDRDEVQRIIRESVLAKKSLEVEYRITTADGRERHVWQKGGCVSSEDQDPRLEGFITDITEKKRAEDALRRQEEHLRAILQANPDPLVVYDHQGHPQYINPSFTRVFGWTFAELQGRKVPFVPEDQADKTHARIRDIFRTGDPVQFDTTRWTKDGRLLNIRVSAALINPAGKEDSALVVNLTDITERKRMEKKLEDMSLYDALTGLYNRAFFEEEMRRLGTMRSSRAAIVVCDIDGLKLINDTLGHSKGDDLLRAAANTLRSCFRTGDIAARIGGDEFAVLVPDTDEETVRARCEQIHAEAARYHQLNPELGLSVSVGFAAAKDRFEEMRALFKRADDAMYKQKLQQSRNSRNETVQALITTMEARDRITDGHAGRLEHFALQMGRSLRLSGERLNDLRLLARFHDLGKVGVPDSILFKPGPLNEEEFEEMKRHCEIGHRIALSTTDLAPIADFILKHHEWWDGQGYPLGLSGEEIPLECRILAVVDAYDTMTNERPYKGTMSQQEAIRELWRHAGTQFEPELVELFTRIVQEADDSEAEEIFRSVDYPETGGETPEPEDKA
jgi:diguanylate cyclase (GGDEF)-like protein/PAS domain S-box-containing protein